MKCRVIRGIMEIKEREEPVAFVARITPIEQLNQGVNR